MFRLFRPFAMNAAVFSVMAVALLATASAASAEELEIPSRTLQEDGMFSIRRNPGALVAEVSLPEDGANISAFRILYAYLSGDNTPEGRGTIPAPEMRSSAPKGPRLAMTVPVTTDADKTATIMRFYLPEGPVPLPWDQRITLKRLPAETIAVIRFSGLGMEGQMNSAESSLRTWLGQHGATATGPARRAFYNPPWTFPWDRRNEVWIPIDPR